jgi:hypothetical protein
MGVMVTGSALHHLTTSIDQEYDPVVEEVFISPNAIYVIVIIFIISHRCTVL